MASEKSKIITKFAANLIWCILKLIKNWQVRPAFIIHMPENDQIRSIIALAPR